MSGNRFLRKNVNRFQLETFKTGAQRTPGT